MGHPKAPILTLFVKVNSNIFVSGGIDGKVNLWRIIPKDFAF